MNGRYLHDTRKITRVYKNLNKSRIFLFLTLSLRRNYHIETSSLIWRANQANQWTGFYMIGPPL